MTTAPSGTSPTADGHDGVGGVVGAGLGKIWLESANKLFVFPSDEFNISKYYTRGSFPP